MPFKKNLEQNSFPNFKGNSMKFQDNWIKIVGADRFLDFEIPKCPFLENCDVRTGTVIACIFEATKFKNFVERYNIFLSGKNFW